MSDVNKDKLDQKANVGILIGYNNNTKGYLVYQPLTGKVVIDRDAKFDEFAIWNQCKSEVEYEEIKGIVPIESQIEESNDSIDDVPSRGIRLLSSIYQNCNVTVLGSQVIPML